MTHTDVVFEHENRLAAGGELVRAGFLVGGRWRGGELGQENSYRGAFAEFALYADMAAALPHDSVAGGKTETGTMAFVLGREKRFEKMLFYFVSHATAVVGHTDADVVSRRELLQRALVFFSG